MLDNLRSSAHGIFGKILLGILVLSFGIWGIGDMFRNGLSGGSGYFATVGKAKITLQEYGVALREKEQELQAKFGKAYTPDLMKKMGVGATVGSELINTKLISEEADSLGIVVGDDDIVKFISRNPAFLDKNGNFDKDIYTATLNNQGFSEQRYVRLLRNEMASELLIHALSSTVMVPSDFVQTVYKVREEKRNAELYQIPASAVHVTAPTEKEIKAYYDANNKMFLTQEYRTVSYIDFKLSDVESKMDISEDEIKHAYDDRAQDFRTPEKRNVEQMIFDKEQDATAAAQKIGAGARFSDLIKTANLSNKGKISLGLIGKQDLPADDAAEVFALKEGAATKPLNSAFGWHIFYVSKIVPETARPLAEVRKDIVNDLKVTKSGEFMSQLANKVEDDMSGGMSLEDIAKKDGYQLQVTAQITHDGKTLDGKKPNVPAYDNFVGVAFSSQEKDHSPVTQTSDGSYFVLRVDKVLPEHARPLSEVSDTIVTELKREAEQKQLKELADETSMKMREGKKPDVTMSTSSSGNIKRSENGEMKLPHALVQELFDIAPHEYTHAYPSASGGYIIASLSSIIPAPEKADPKMLDSIKTELKGSLRNDILTAYLSYLRTKYPVSVNQAVLRAKEAEGEE